MFVATCLQSQVVTLLLCLFSGCKTLIWWGWSNGVCALTPWIFPLAHVLAIRLCFCAWWGLAILAELPFWRRFSYSSGCMSATTPFVSFGLLGRGDVLLVVGTPLVVICYWCRITRKQCSKCYTCHSRKQLVLFWHVMGFDVRTSGPKYKVGRARDRPLHLRRVTTVS